jgi:serine protease Do
MPNLNFDWKDNDNFNRSYSYSYNGRPRLGIKAQDTEDGKGVKVLDVDGESAAEKAGIKKDDLITEFDGKKVTNTDELASAARESKEKPAIKITFNRDGKSQTVEIKTPKKLKTANL